MSEFGWIKLHRRITEWHHWSSPNVLATFIHLLTLANYEPKEWNGIVVQRGQLVTTQRNLAEDIGCGRNTLRRCLATLQETGEIKVEIVTAGDRKDCSLITILNYNEYQGDFEKMAQPTSGATNSELYNPQMEPPTTPMNTSEVGRHTTESHPPSGAAQPPMRALTKEYIRNNIYSTLTTTTTTRERAKSESEILDGSEPRTNPLNTGDDFEERKKVAVKKERSDFAKLVEANAEVVRVLSENKQWVEITAKASKATEAEVREKLKEFELTNNANNNQLEVSKAYRHFVKWFNLNRDIERRRTRAKPQTKPKPGAVSDFWNSPEAKAIEERNRREGEELMKKYKINEI